jgi:hypothetical protein
VAGAVPAPAHAATRSAASRPVSRLDR